MRARSRSTPSARLLSGLHAYYPSYYSLLVSPPLPRLVPLRSALSLRVHWIPPRTLFSRADVAVRFMGLRENKQEQERDFEELSALAKAGKPVYGDSDLTPYLQGVASRNSTYSQFKLQTMPW